MPLSINYQYNRPYLTLSDANRQPSNTAPYIVIPSTYGEDYCACYGNRQQVADMNNDTLIQVLQSIPEEKLTTTQQNAIKRCCELVKEYDDLTASLEMEGEER